MSCCSGLRGESPATAGTPRRVATRPPSARDARDTITVRAFAQRQLKHQGLATAVSISTSAMPPSATTDDPLVAGALATENVFEDAV